MRSLADVGPILVNERVPIGWSIGFCDKTDEKLRWSNANLALVNVVVNIGQYWSMGVNLKS